MESCKIVIKDGWAICPVCGKGKLLKLGPDTAVHRLPCKCKRCGQVSQVNIDQRLSQCRESTSA